LLKKFLAMRIIHLLLVLIGISFLSFFLANIASVDPAEAYVRRMSRTADEEMIAQYREEFGFNQSIPRQYLSWVKNVVQFDFGNSYISGRPAMLEVVSALPHTLALSLLACLLILLLAVPLGVASATHPGRLADKLISGFSFVAISVPGYSLGLLLLLVFGVNLKIMPVVGHGHPLSLLCGAVVLAFPMIGMLSRLLRALLLENLNSDYVIYAKARGISKRNVMRNHLLRTAAPACITMYGQNIGYLIAGTAIVETIFSTPGLGQYALNAAINRDFPVINAYIVLMAFCFILCNTTAEIFGMLLNPAWNKESA